MSDQPQTTCALCEEPFQEGEVVVTFRVWPDGEKPGHLDCLLEAASGDIDEDDD